MDIRANGKGYEEFVQRVVERYDATYVRGRVSRIYSLDGHLVVQGADTLLGKQVEVQADMVVLATAMQPRADAKELARKLGMSTDQDNWFTEAHPKLRPVEVLTAGIYLAGACQYPKDIPDTVAQASGAAAKVVDLFAKTHLLSEPMIAWRGRRTCAACLLCTEVCPFTAIEAVGDHGPGHAQSPARWRGSTRGCATGAGRASRPAGRPRSGCGASATTRSCCRSSRWR